MKNLTVKQCVIVADYLEEKAERLKKYTCGASPYLRTPPAATIQALRDGTDALTDGELGAVVWTAHPQRVEAWAREWLAGRDFDVTTKELGAALEGVFSEYCVRRTDREGGFRLLKVSREALDLIEGIAQRVYIQDIVAAETIFKDMPPTFPRLSGVPHTKKDIEALQKYFREIQERLEEKWVLREDRGEKLFTPEEMSQIRRLLMSHEGIWQAKTFFFYADEAEESAPEKSDAFEAGVGEIRRGCEGTDVESEAAGYALDVMQAVMWKHVGKATKFSKSGKSVIFASRELRARDGLLSSDPREALSQLSAAGIDACDVTREDFEGWKQWHEKVRDTSPKIVVTRHIEVDGWKTKVNAINLCEGRKGYTYYVPVTLDKSRTVIAGDMYPRKVHPAIADDEAIDRLIEGIRREHPGVADARVVKRYQERG